MATMTFQPRQKRQLLDFAPEYGWSDEPIDRQVDSAKEDVLYLHNENATGTKQIIRVCNCWRCIRHKTRTKAHFKRIELGRKLTTAEYNRLEEQVRIETEAEREKEQRHGRL